MSRRRQEAAEKAAMQASEAGRVLQAQRQETEPQVEQSEKPDGDRPPLRNEPRRQAMDEVLQRDLETKQKDMAQLGVQPEPEVKPEPQPEVKVEPEPQSESIKEVQLDPVEQPVVPAEMVTVKVDGEEFQVSKADIDEAGGVSAYRKERALENRLRKANEAVGETRKTQAALMEFLQRQLQPQQPQMSVDDFLKTKVDVVRYGTPEESAAALREVVEKLMPRVDPNAITQNATMKMQQTLAVQKFREEFQDVVGNPMLLKLATTLENERLSEMYRAGQLPTDWSTFYRQLGNELRPFVKQSQPDKAQTATPSTPSPVADKEARKASIVTLPTASARAELPKEPKPETREETLNDMRRARGFKTG